MPPPRPSCTTRVLLLALALALALASGRPAATAGDTAGSVSIHPGWPPCERRALQASGYIDIPGVAGTKHIFYWLFGPRTAPAPGTASPVVLWLTGGPGCSSGIALALENGPCLLDEARREMVVNPYGWNEEAYLMYVDQPVGTGYSYSENKADYVSNETGVAEDMYQVLQRFAATFSEPSIALRNPFYITGESYAGHYIPAIAQRIMVGNQRGEGLPLLLKAVAIGNGWTNPRVQYNSYAFYSYFYCKLALGEPCVTQEDYQRMLALQPLCDSAVKRCEVLPLPEKETACEHADRVCNELSSYYHNTGLNNYDIRRPCEGPLCYPMNYTTDFFNDPAVKASLGVEEARVWETCSADVGSHFGIDHALSYENAVKALLAGGIRVMIYVGDMDYICNYVGNWQWVSQLEWPGQAAFLVAPDNEFLVAGRWAGRERRDGLLSFVRIYAAGHMVPMDQPVVSSYMLQQFLKGEPLAN